MEEALSHLLKRLESNERAKDLQKLEKMLLYGEKRIQDVERKVRMGNTGMYSLSFRYARSKPTCDEYIDILEIFLSRIFDSYLQLAPYQGDVKFEIYRKTCLQKIL